MLKVADILRALGKFRLVPDAQQQQAIGAPADARLVIDAGPGNTTTTRLPLTYSSRH